MLEYNLRKETLLGRRIIKIAVVIFVILLLALEGVSIYIVKKFDSPKKLEVTKTPLSYGVKDYETVKFKSNKGDITLSGWILKSGKSKKTIILCHGYTDNMIYQYSGGKIVNNFIEFAKPLIKAGYNVMLFDFRGHGNMAGVAPSTIGFKEQQDLLGAIKLIKQKGIGEKVGLIGFSMGASTALSCVDKTKDVSFVIADSPFSDLKTYLSDNMSHWTGFPKYPFTPLVLLNFQLLDGVKFSDVSPKNSVKRTNIPIMLIHGLKDTTIPYTESIIIKKNLKNPKSKIVFFKNAIHIASYYSEPKRYEKLVLQFINQH